MIDIRQTPQYVNYLQKIGWKVERAKNINYFIKKIPLLGSVLKLQRPEKIRHKDIGVLCARYRVFQIIAEPKTESDAKYLTSIGFRLSKSPYLPTKTLQLDLTMGEEQLFTGLKKDARYALRKLQMLNDKCQIENDTEKFRDAWKNSVGMKRYVPPLSHLLALKNSFKNDCNFLLYFDDSNHRSRTFAGAIFLKTSDVAYYWQAFTNKEGRKIFAQYKIVWEGIKWAKKKGAKVFDFEGIYDKRFPQKSWLGFTHFKKSFGGVEVEYPGAFVKNQLPFNI